MRFGNYTSAQFTWEKKEDIRFLLLFQCLQQDEGQLFGTSRNRISALLDTNTIE